MTAAVLAVVPLRRRNRVRQRGYEAEARDENADGLADVHRTGTMNGNR